MTGIMKLNITKRFDGNCKVYAFDVRIDGEMYSEVSKDKAYRLIIQAQEVAEELDLFIDARGLEYLRAA
ncbi:MULTISPECIES: hypothetical protein [unclassified Rhizobium]|uniref:hypothetical protein n=1 Tax=unclassified Rhizobium TaxID=2613769 RepID=UPI0006F53AA5|nr:MULTISPECIES: hypothetical protein [unclassified Rhizobium]KQV33131.1 hypothetical protein ASC86_18395 [Rhizobium sp. Root1212]KRD21591.1 hypothetical protein ASE37_18895 [Rhizobium sp. Root268]